MATVSLLALLAVPAEGKERMAMARDILDKLALIAKSDPDLELRRAAQKARIIISELPFAHAIIGDINEKGDKPDDEKETKVVKPAEISSSEDTNKD